MPSLVDAVQAALLRKKVPVFKSGSIHDLAQQLGMSSPVSIKNLMGVLSNLPPTSVTFDSGSIAAGSLKGSAYLYLQSDGAISWGGNVNEDGVIGENFIFAVALLDVKDNAGNTPVFSYEGNVAGQFNIGDSDDKWARYEAYKLISDNWEQVKTTRVEFKLHASTDPLQVVETVFTTIAIAVVSIFSGSAVLSCPEGSHWDCGYDITGQSGSLIPGDPRYPPNSGTSVTYMCRCEYN